MRTFFLFVAGFLLSSAAHAQLGVRAGGNWAGQTTNPFDHLDGGGSQATTSRVGYQLGLTYGVSFGQRWALVPELEFSRERQHVQVRGDDNPNLSFQADYALTRSYVSVPVLLRLNLGRVYLEAGPQASLLVGGRGEGTRHYSGPLAGSILYDPLVDQSATESYTRLDAGACLGVGVRVAAGLGVNVRAYQGLVGSNRGEESSARALPKGGEQAYRQTLQLALTYTLTPP